VSITVRTFLIVAPLLFASVASAEELCPKYGDCVPSDAFACTDIARSSFITRVCFDAAKRYMIVRLNATDYHYCEIGQSVVSAFLAAKSMGSFYNKNIKSNGEDGPFDCRTHSVPSY
jgi:hypothetical protein